MKANDGRSVDPRAAGTIALALGVFLLTVLAYLPALGNGFVNWDDDIYVTSNPVVCDSWDRLLRYAFLEFHASNWHPLTWLSHGLDCAIWGLNPTGHHLTSIFIHAVNSGLVVLVSSRVLRGAIRWGARPSGRETGTRGVGLASAVAGILFGIHPIHVESVAWVAERKDVLAAFFYLSSLLVWTVRAGNASDPGRARPRLYGNLAGAVALFAMALLAKPMAITLPVVLLILDWYPFGRLRDPATRRVAIVEFLPFAVLSIGAGTLAVMAQSGEAAIVPIEAVGIASRLLVAANASVTYLGKLLLPLDLLPFYPHPRNVSLGSLRHALTGATVLGVTVASLATARRHPWFLAAWGAYLAMLAPVLGVIQAGGQAMADRYMYLPSLPPFLLIGVGIEGVVARTRGRGRLTLLAGCVMVAGFLVLGTVRQIGTWRSSIDLWNHLLEHEPKAVPLAYYNRAQAYLELGRVDRAIADYSSAISLHPRYRDAVYNRGAAYERIGDFRRAAEDYQAAIALDPSDARAYNNLGVVQARVGELLHAIRSFDQAIQRDPGFAAALFNRGLTHAQTGQVSQAIQDLSRACELGMEQGCQALQARPQGASH